MKALLITSVIFLALNSYAQNVNIPDANFKSYLVGNSAINTNSDSEIQISEAISFNDAINCSYNQITDLTGIEYFTSLTNLTCNDNDLTSLNVSQNTALTVLNCDNNQLASLDVSQNIYLNYLDCENNQITALNLSNNSALSGVWCGHNQLLCLNIKNGNNTNLIFDDFYADDNANLTCIEVDNELFPNTFWPNIDSQTSYSQNCNNACSGVASINEIYKTPKQLLRIVDLMGRETLYKPNTPLIYIYSDGTTEKVFKMEE